MSFVLMARSPKNPKEWVIKRIIAVEGDIVETRPKYPERNVVVPHNHFWVEGDEGFHSQDSNSYGPV
jgi:inner membrane protease subunit 2